MKLFKNTKCKCRGALCALIADTVQKIENIIRTNRVADFNQNGDLEFTGIQEAVLMAVTMEMNHDTGEIVVREHPIPRNMGCIDLTSLDGALDDDGLDGYTDDYLAKGCETPAHSRTNSPR